MNEKNTPLNEEKHITKNTKSSIVKKRGKRSGIVISALAIIALAGTAYAAICTSCKGSGRSAVSCMPCKGTGRTNGTMQCFTCGGTGWLKCTSCRGTGQR